MTGDAWARDPGTLELIFHEALRAGDMVGVSSALRLLAVVDPRRAATLRHFTRLAIALDQVARDDRDTPPVPEAP